MSQNPNNVYFGFSNQQFLSPGQQQGMLQQGMLQQNARLQGTAQGGLLQMQPGLQLMSSSLMSGMQSGTSALQNQAQTQNRYAFLTDQAAQGGAYAGQMGQMQQRTTIQLPPAYLQQGLQSNATRIIQSGTMQGTMQGMRPQYSNQPLFQMQSNAAQMQMLQQQQQQQRQAQAQAQAAAAARAKAQQQQQQQQEAPIRPKRQAARNAKASFKAFADLGDGGDDTEEEYDEAAEGEDDDDDGDYGRQSMGGSGFGRQAAPARKPGRPKKAAGRSSGRSNKVSYAEDDDEELDSDIEEQRRQNQIKKDALPAFEDPSQFDDEVERVITHKDNPEAEAEPGDVWASRLFLVKWKRYSYIHCSWDTRATLMQLGGWKRVQNYIKRQEDQAITRARLSREEQELMDLERSMEEQLVEEHMQVERVVAERAGIDGTVKYLIKWKGVPYSECTWETQEDTFNSGGQKEVDLFLERETRLLEASNTVQFARERFKIRGSRALDQQPQYLTFGQLRDYQLDGLNWLTYSWLQDKNCILADEMGLGKTVQCASFIGLLAESLLIRGPFLVVVPLSTIPNWMREFKRWVPFVNSVVYIGDGKSREVIREFEFNSQRRMGGGRMYKFEVLLTTYELCLKDADILRNIRWAYLMVDEAHRLKNCESALYTELITWSFKNKLLVTGTPLQNSIKELWALLHFLEPDKFPSLEAFEQQHSLQSAEGLTSLHAALRPHLLRRVIKDVEKSLPPKNERILRVEMTPLQKQYYKWILQRNFKELNKGAKGSGQISLLNIISELKKITNHPFLFESVLEDFRGKDDATLLERMVLTSGKMVVLDKLLRKLKETGHRVLLFSQMVRVLDIISDYMRRRGYQHQRLDGSTPAAARHQAMEHFNKPGSPDFAFLLSTRAGGLGINLATADTVIIFDSDWNPQNDLQAMSRAHRIGQTETVNIYRFVCSNSVEEDILERAKKKMVLDHLVIQKMDTSGRTILDPTAAKANAKALFGKEELAAILRFGAEELFKVGEHSAEVVKVEEKRLMEESIDAILERAEVVDNAVQQQQAENNELLNSFNVATFKNQEDDATFWSRLIAAQQEEEAEEEKLQPEELLPRAARMRAMDRERGAEEEAPAGRRGARGRGGRGRGRGRGLGNLGDRPDGDKTLPFEAGAHFTVSSWYVEVDEQGQPLVKPEDAAEDEAEMQANMRTLSRRDAANFIRAVKRYGLAARLPDITAEVGPSMEEVSEGARISLWNSLISGCERACEMATAEAQKDGEAAFQREPLLDFFGVTVKATELLGHCQSMELLAQRVEPLKDPYSQFKVDAALQATQPKWGKLINWTPRDDAALLLGVYYYGLGNWDQVAGDRHLQLTDKIAGALTMVRDNPPRGPGEESGPKASHLETRVLGLLKKMRDLANPPGRREGRRRAAGAGGAPSRSKRKAAGPDGPDKRQRVEGDYVEAVELTRDECLEMLGKVLPEIKRLRKLQQQQDLSKADVLERTKKYLHAIGQHIEVVVAQHGAGVVVPLWDFVSRAILNGLSGDKLERLYTKIKSSHAAGEPLHSYGAAEPAGRGRSSDGYAEGAAGFPGRSGPGLQYRPNAGSAAADAGGEYAAGRPGFSLQPAQPKARPAAAAAAGAADQPGLDPSWESWEQQQEEEAHQPGEQHAGQPAA